MPYILKKTNGTTLTTVQDASVDNSTSLVFVGRNYSGYGQPIEENLVKLLEHFSNTVQPTKPVQGQLWFNSSPAVKRLQVCYDGSNFRDLSNVPYSTTPPPGPNTGDLWWDSYNQQIKVYDSLTDTWTATQPYGGASSSWDFSRIEDINSNNNNAIRGLSGNATMVLFANNQYYPSAASGLNVRFPIVKTGINLPNADPVTGSSAASTSSGYLFWGTAAESLFTKKIIVETTPSTATHYIPLLGKDSGIQSLVTTSTFFIDLNTNVLNVVASSAKYADIAERYEADNVYEPGTVLVIGGEKEVTVTTIHGDARVAGIVSTNPAYMMNKDAGSDKTHPYIALKGRVPCKVYGPVNKGDLLVTSTIPGYAESMYINPDSVIDSPNAVLGIALASHDSGPGIIEVKV